MPPIAMSLAAVAALSPPQIATKGCIGGADC